ncbi:MAG: metallophosphoesterase [Clostridia bacterium]|nr:metallophosphoesterase [Clostridia bacterium]
MKIFAISDLHLSFSSDKPMDIFGACWDNYWQKICDDWQSKVADEDIILIAGDVSWAMTLENALIDIAEIAKLKGRKVFIKGNHDYWWNSLSKIRKALPENFFVIQNDALKFDGVVFAGSRLWNLSGGSEEDKKILAREYTRMELSLKSAQKLRSEGDRLIAMCHYPPFDATLGDSAFTQLFEMYGVSAVVYGHLHGKDCRAVNYLEKNGVEYFLTSCDKVDNRLVHIATI